MTVTAVNGGGGTRNLSPPASALRWLDTGLLPEGSLAWASVHLGFCSLQPRLRAPYMVACPP